MNAIICKNGLLRLEQAEIPAVGRDEVLVKVTALCLTRRSATLSSDGWIAAAGISGVVESSNAAAFSAGDAVTALPYLACGHCPACLEGAPQACRHGVIFGCDCDGTAAEYAVLPAAALVKTEAATAEIAAAAPIAEALETVRAAGMRFNHRVAVCGSDASALLLGALCRKSGAAAVVFFTEDEASAVRVRGLGFEAHVLSAPETMKNLSAELTGKKFFDIVFETTGTEAAVQGMLAAAKRGGTFVITAAPEEAPVFHIATAIRNQVAFRGVRFCSGATLRAVLQDLPALSALAAPFLAECAGLEAAAGAVNGGGDVLVRL